MRSSKEKAKLLKKARQLIEKADKVDSSRSKQKLEFLKKKIKKIQTEIVETIAYIKAQTYDEDTKDKVIEAAIKKIADLKEEIKRIKPELVLYTSGLKNVADY